MNAFLKLPWKIDNDIAAAATDDELICILGVAHELQIH